MMKHKPSTKILIIDDFIPHAHHVAEQIKSNNLQQFTSLNYDIKVTSTGFEALLLSQDFQPDCILLDYALSDMDILEFLNSLAEINGEFIVPIVLLVEQEDETNIAKFMRHGVHDCLVKGKFGAAQLLWTIFCVLEKAELQKQLYRQREELKIFADRMAHDMMRSLSKLSLYAEYLEMSSDTITQDMERQDILSAIVDSVDQTVNLVRSFRDYAHVERMPVSLSTVNLNNILDHVLLALKPQIDELELQIQVDSLPTVIGDPMGLGQLLEYLIMNSIRFVYGINHNQKYRKKSTNDGPAIYIKARKCGNKWQIGLTNSCIYRDDCDKKESGVSNSFIQQPNDKQFLGVNIELAICKKIVEQHGGAIWFCSTPTQGITSYFTIEQDLRSDNKPSNGSTFDDIALFNHSSLSTILQKSIDMQQPC